MFVNLDYILSFDWVTTGFCFFILGFLVVSQLMSSVAKELKVERSKWQSTLEGFGQDTQSYIANVLTISVHIIILFLGFALFFLGVIAWNSF